MLTIDLAVEPIAEKLAIPPRAFKPAPKKSPLLSALIALIAGTMMFAPGMKDAIVDTIGLDATLATALKTPLTALPMPLTTFLIPFQRPPRKNSGSFPPILK